MEINSLSLAIIQTWCWSDRYKDYRFKKPEKPFWEEELSARHFIEPVIKENYVCILGNEIQLKFRNLFEGNRREFETIELHECQWKRHKIYSNPLQLFKKVPNSRFKRRCFSRWSFFWTFRSWCVAFRSRYTAVVFRNYCTLFAI